MFASHCEVTSADVRHVQAVAERDEYLSRFYRQVGLYAVARELGLPTEAILAQVQSTVDASTAATQPRARAA
jgi:hypothetical protein